MKVLVLLSVLSLLVSSRTLAAPASGAPGFATIQRLCHRVAKLRNPRAHQAGVPVGDGRFVAVVHHQNKAKTQWLLHLVQLKRDKEAWALTGRWPLPMKSSERGGNPMSPAELCSIGAQEWKPASALFIKDYDGDGKAELLVRLKFCWMVPAIGPMQVRTLQIHNLDKKGIIAKAALKVEVEDDARPTTLGRRLGRYSFVDLDKDGHPDFRLRFTHEHLDYVKNVAMTCTERWEEQYLWKAAGDRYVRRKAKRRSRKCKRAE